MTQCKMLTARVLVFVFICIVLSKAMTDEEKELMESLHKICVGKTGASEEIISRAQKGVYAEDENLKCYMRCILDELGVIEDGGTLDVEGIIALIPDDIKDSLTPSVRKCGGHVAANECETAYHFYKCTYEDNPLIYIP